MSNFQFEDLLKDDVIEEIQFGNLDSLNSKLDAVNSNPATSSASPSHFDHKQRKDDRLSAMRSYTAAVIGQVPSGQARIPKKSPLSLVKVAPFDPDTHAKDKEEFSYRRSTSSITMTNNVAGEYSHLIGGNTTTPKRSKFHETLSSRREQKQSVFSRTRPAPILSPAASVSCTRTKQERWKENGQFSLKRSYSEITALGSPRKPISDSNRKFSNLSTSTKLTQSLPSHSQSLLTPKSLTRRCGDTVENPVELSDDDEDEVEDREMKEIWSSGLSTDIAIGQIWFGRCRLLSHGPSRLLLNLTSISSKKSLTIEFTPYMSEVISLQHIMETRGYTRLFGGCTFLSILVSDCHQWQDWTLRYKFRRKRWDPVWITMFFGQSELRNLLETMCKELPCYEEIVSPFSHLKVIKKDLIDQYPCRGLRLVSNSKLNRKKVRKLVVCRYPLQSRDCITITNGDLESLDPHEFLNDTVIDFKLTHLRSSGLSPKLNYHIFSSFFYKRFVTSDMSYDSVKRWTDRQDLFTKDFWLIPICEALHWTLAVVCYPNVNISDERNPVMLFYDSLGGSGRKAFETIRKYIGAALKQPKRLRSVDSMMKIETEFRFIDVRVPRQTNSYDCGIYLLLFAEYFLKDPPNDVCSPHRPEWFDQSVADGHRNKIRGEILEIAYRQSPGNPGPVSTEYVKITCDDDDDCSAVDDDTPIPGENAPAIALDDVSSIAVDDVSAIAVDDVSSIPADGTLEAVAEDLLEPVMNSDSIIVV